MQTKTPDEIGSFRNVSVDLGLFTAPSYQFRKKWRALPPPPSTAWRSLEIQTTGDAAELVPPAFCQA